jgi:hypothetical protein
MRKCSLFAPEENLPKVCIVDFRYKLIVVAVAQVEW